MASSAIRTYERKPGFSRNGSAKKLHNSFSGYGQESIPPERSYTSETVVDSSEIRRARSKVTTGPCVAQNFTTISADAPSDTPSEDSCSLKRKSMSLNGNRNKESLICNLPFGDLTRGQRKQLRNKLKLDLQYVRSLYMKVEAREMEIHSLLKGSAGNYRPRVNGSVSNGHYFPPAAESSYREGWNSRQMNVTIPEHSSDGLNSFGKDKRTPKANQLYASSDFVSGKDKFPSEKNKPKFLMNGKRSLQGGDEQRDLKRIKIDPSYRKKMAEFLKQCGALLKKLMGHKFGWVFNEPVDAVKLKLDDYHFIIKKPMDLGTIKKKLESGTYSLPSEFCDDVRLTFANAMKYNPPGHDVFVMADTLRGMFESKWKTIAEKIKELDSASDRIVNMNSREALGSVEQSIAPPAAMQPLASSSKPAAPIKAKPTPVVKSAVKAKVKAPVQHRRHMTFAEKQQLSESLANLPPEKLEQAVQIMRKNPNLTQNDDEIEVDIESFDPDTLWELHKFVMDSKGSSVTEERSLEGGYERAANHQVSSSIPKTMRSNLKSNEVGEEEVDIGDDMPAKEFPPVVIEKDRVVNNKEISSSSSSSSSGSSSSDSDSASSSGSDSDADEGHSVEAASKISSADKV
ncbi:hypothetical protein KP509_38G016200 [Ceratopteris richardii]|uniref:Uncharacterized protein n=1 Tax=Ceratopteris richardii TaxID=49495 RepID=A0A8T2Q2U3_CERRI|nr:hypothetical protein KP509_38G016200 [Ceratopteris richardii]